MARNRLENDPSNGGRPNDRRGDEVDERRALDAVRICGWLVLSFAVGFCIVYFGHCDAPAEDYGEALAKQRAIVAGLKRQAILSVQKLSYRDAFAEQNMFTLDMARRRRSGAFAAATLFAGALSPQCGAALEAWHNVTSDLLLRHVSPAIVTNATAGAQHAPPCLAPSCALANALRAVCPRTDASPTKPHLQHATDNPSALASAAANL